MKISLKDYRKSCEDYQKHWALLNKTLYSLCRKHPHHTDIPAINAKLWIIGRTLATGIERMIKSTGEQGSSLDQLSNHLYKNHRTVDAIFNQLTSIAEPLSPEKLETIVIVHGRFLKVLANKVQKNRTARSFASKYMHFHQAAVPIYDNYASEELRRICRWDDNFKVFELPKVADEEYYYFVLRFWQLYQKFRQVVRSVNVRFLDCYLLWMAAD